MTSKKKRLHQVLEAALDGRLTEHERRRFEDLLRTSPGLRAEFEQRKALRKLVAAEAAEGFDPFFATRVMGRISAEMRDPVGFSAELAPAFRRVLVAAAVLIMALATYNISANWEYRFDSNPLEMALSLPPSTLETSIEYYSVEP